jgi:hypothetical protein
MQDSPNYVTNHLSSTTSLRTLSSPFGLLPTTATAAATSRLS